MTDSELEAIRRVKMRELQKQLSAKQEKTEETNPNKVLDKIFRGRAWEVFNTANQQYPVVMRKLQAILVDLTLSGKLREVTGQQLYLFLRKLGLNVRLNTKIRFTEHGKLKSLSEKIKEDLQRA